MQVAWATGNFSQLVVGTAEPLSCSSVGIMKPMLLRNLQALALNSDGKQGQGSPTPEKHTLCGHYY